jgi:chlorite dismutase
MGRPGAGGHNGTDAPETSRQFVKFTFFRVDPAWRTLSAGDRSAQKRELCETVDGFGGQMLLGSYSLMGLRGDAEFLLWQVADEMEAFQSLATAVFSTGMGPYLNVTYSYLSLTRRSIYKTPRESESRLRVQPSDAKYLFVYPFVKTRPWYELSKDTRQEMMNEHIAIGRKYPSVKLNTTYSYGLDDQEFVVAFETDNPSDFLDLVMELRETKASMYTLRDTPTFTCVAMPLADALDALGAPGDAATHVIDGAGSDWTAVAATGDVPAGSAKVVYFQGEQVALFNVDGTFFAVSNRCSHANGPLAEGRVEGCTVTCPWHDSQFDLRTGEPSGGPAVREVRTYEVKAEGTQVLLAHRAERVRQA